MIRKILASLGLLVLAFLAYVAMKPPVQVVSRQARLAAPPAAVFPHINDFHKWQAWSPWAELDPKAKASFEGPEAGVGAAFSWAGNREVGEGKMTIVESTPSDMVRMRLDFIKPFASASEAVFQLAPDGDGTNVTWTMRGDQPFMARVACTLMYCERMIGNMFLKGLKNLNAVVAPGAGPPAQSPAQRP